MIVTVLGLFLGILLLIHWGKPAVANLLLSIRSVLRDQSPDRPQVSDPKMLAKCAELVEQLKQIGNQLGRIDEAIRTLPKPINSGDKREASNGETARRPQPATSHPMLNARYDGVLDGLVEDPQGSFELSWVTDGERRVSIAESWSNVENGTVLNERSYAAFFAVKNPAGGGGALNVLEKAVVRREGTIWKRQALGRIEVT